MGLETCKQLAERGMKVVLTARGLTKAQAAAATLEGVEVDAQHLDVTDQESVDALAAHVSKTYGRLDVLVNNAGAVLDTGEFGSPEASVFVADPARVADSFAVNAIGPLRLVQALVPLMQKNGYGRIVNVSTGMAGLKEMNGGHPGYRMSKTALNALTRIVADELTNTNIKVNSVCPGWVRTDMGGKDANLSVEEGVDTTIWLATLRDDGPSGGFFRDFKRIDW
jgi:NAD(P)-dependent dehydrogenase (short-subunit alcohol dehydrogenase family)